VVGVDVAPGHPGSDPLPDRILPPPAEGGEWTLTRTRSVLAELGDPQLAYDTIHVGGTNGKGSVAAMVASVLTNCGHRVGLYTSPHLCAFRERFRIDGAPIARDSLMTAATEAYSTIAAGGLTYFEAATVLGFHAFARARVDVAVVEVGLGGRLDATNVLDPRVTVVTNVALDHQEFLGGTLAQIAAEKAGIVKTGVPLVTAARGTALTVLRRVAARVGAPMHEVSAPTVEPAGHGSMIRVSWAGEEGGVGLTVPLAGAHQALNAAVAVRCLDLLPDRLRPSSTELRVGLARTRWPGRLQVEHTGNVTWLFDVAHNPDGAEALAAALAVMDLPSPRVAVIGVLADKDWAAMIPPVAERVERVILVDPPSAPQVRRWNPHDAARALDLKARVTAHSDFAAAIEEARAVADGGSVIVTGSHHTVGDALLELGMAPCEPG
jgi:dihydrofolate synthase/folylpolyglutamate synthase